MVKRRFIPAWRYWWSVLGFAILSAGSVYFLWRREWVLLFGWGVIALVNLWTLLTTRPQPPDGTAP